MQRYIIIMRLIANLIFISIGIIILIRLNITIVIIIINEAVGVEQDHGGSKWFLVMDSDSGASEAERPTESDRRKRRETRKHKTMGERKNS